MYCSIADLMYLTDLEQTYTRTVRDWPASVVIAATRTVRDWLAKTNVPMLLSSIVLVLVAAHLVTTSAAGIVGGSQAAQTALTALTALALAFAMVSFTSHRESRIMRDARVALGHVELQCAELTRHCRELEDKLVIERRALLGEHVPRDVSGLIMGMTNDTVPVAKRSATRSTRSTRSMQSSQRLSMNSALGAARGCSAERSEHVAPLPRLRRVGSLPVRRCSSTPRRRRRFAL